MFVKRGFFLILGWLSLLLGTMGIVLPLLPTVPFYLLTVFCFTKSSPRLHSWFLGTGLYEKYVKLYVQRDGMSNRLKGKIMLMVTLLMSFGFIMSPVIYARVIIALVWLGHLLYLCFFVKTIPKM